MLKKLLLILGKSNPTADETELLQFVIDTATEKVLSYCNVDKIPEGLTNTVVRMAADIWRTEGYGNEERPKEVTEVKRGDVSTSFTPISTTRNVQSDYLSKYKSILNCYRKLRW